MLVESICLVHLRAGTHLGYASLYAIPHWARKVEYPSSSHVPMQEHLPMYLDDSECDVQIFGGACR